MSESSIKAVMLVASVIVPDPNNVRKRIDDEQETRQTDSIRRHGILVPLRVKAHGDGKYVIQDGHGRFRCGKAAGLTEFPCIVVANDDTIDREIQLATALHKGELSVLDLGTSLDALMREKGWSLAKVAAEVGLDKSEVFRAVKIHQFKTPRILELLEQGTLTVSVAFELCNAIANGKPAADIDAIAEEAAKDLTGKEVAKRIAALGKKKPTKAATPKTAKIVRNNSGIKISIAYPSMFAATHVIAELNAVIAELKKGG